MSDAQSAPQALSIVVVVAFGEPSVGKSLLLSNLETLNGRADLEDEPFYATIDEPTADAEICEQIKRVYEQKNAVAATEGGDNDSLLVLRVQRMILRRRIAQYKQFIEERLASSMHRARLAGRKSLVIVCDGHTLTDSYLYVRSRIESGQLSQAQFLEHQLLQSTLLSDVASALRQPRVCATCHWRQERQDASAPHSCLSAHRDRARRAGERICAACQARRLCRSDNGATPRLDGRAHCHRPQRAKVRAGRVSSLCARFGAGRRDARAPASVAHRPAQRQTSALGRCRGSINLGFRTQCRKKRDATHFLVVQICFIFETTCIPPPPPQPQQQL